MGKPKLHASFNQLDSEDTFIGLPQTDFALDSVLETLPRELIQNTYDARQDGEVPQINFFFECLREGEGLSEFKEAIDWDELEPHLEAVAEDDEKLGVQKVLDQIRDGELYLLGVEDFNAVGLEGGEDSRGTKYASLVKDFADSTKKEGGGVHGVGASVLWAFSGFKLVLFHSVPEEEDEPKLVGRLDLPDHEISGQEYKGGGWLGVDDGTHDRMVALRDLPDNLTETLHIDRADGNGTTALVVGFREPTRRTRSPAEIVEKLYQAAAMYYWPLIVDDGIEVTVQGPSDTSPRTVEPGTVDRVAPYVKAYESWENPDGEFGDPGSVAVEEVEFTVPPTDTEPARTGTLALVVRLADDETDLNKYRNDVAMFRGARHVVKYRGYGAASRTTGQDFHALLLAGGAKHTAGLAAADIPDDTDRAIESFFRDAEPEAHDTWEKPTQKLAQTYDDDNPSQLITSFLKSDIKATLQRMLGSAQTDSNERVDTLGEEFPFFEDDHNSGRPGPGPGPGSGSSPFDDMWVEGSYDQAHEYEGGVTLESSPGNSWTLTLSIDEVDGSNRTIDQIDIADWDSPQMIDDEAGDGAVTFTFDSTTTKIDFDLTSVPVGDEILAGQTRVVFDYDLTGGGGA